MHPRPSGRAAAQVTLIEDDDVIETFAADRADNALHIGVLSRGSWRGNDLLNTHCLDTVTEGLAVGRISVSQQKARRSVPGRASVICRASQTWVGFWVMSKEMTLRRSWPRTLWA